MDEGLQNKSQFREKLRNKFRLVIMNDETFQEMKSFRLSLLNIYTLLSVVLVLLSIFIISFIIFTPIKKLIPGYGEVENNSIFLELNEKIVDLETHINDQAIYINGVQNLLSGVDVDPDQKKSSSEIMPKPLQNNLNLTEKESESVHKLDQLFFVSPLYGSISAGFMIDKKHFGVDILAPANTPVKSIMDGVIIASDWSLETGNTISVQHANNIISVYKHNSVLLKETGNRVKAGEALAIIGNTGTLSDGPHLHFELWFDRRPVDPEEYITF
jgi:murein DD-endopeptidase MepM/ murein hydrolase activator NlpD